MTPEDAAPIAERTGPDALRIVRQFNASREVLWLMFSDPAHMRRWWGPNYVTCLACSADLRVGGAWSISMEGGEGQLYHVEGVYREVRAPERLVYTWAWRNDGALGPESIVTLELKDDGPARSTLTLIHTELPEDMADSHLGGWSSTLDRLVEALTDAAG